MTETQRVIRVLGHFFDMMNTRCLEEGIQKRKPDLAHTNCLMQKVD